MIKIKSGPISGSTSKVQAKHFDSNSISIFKAFALFMQKKQRKYQNKGMPKKKTLQAILNKIDQF